MAQTDDTSEELTKAFRALAAEAQSVSIDEIDVDVALQTLFIPEKNEHNFLIMAVERAGLTEGEAEWLWRACQLEATDRLMKGHNTLQALQWFAAFSERAMNLLEQKSWRLDEPSIRSIARTFATRRPHFSGIDGDLAHPPKSRRYATIMFVASGIIAVALIAWLTWANCDPLNRDVWSEFWPALTLIGGSFFSIWAAILAPGIYAVLKAPDQKEGP